MVTLPEALTLAIVSVAWAKALPAARAMHGKSDQVLLHESFLALIALKELVNRF